MKYIFLSTLLATTLAAWIPQIDSTNFQMYKQNSPVLFVKYFAPWCTYCQKLEPEFIKAAGEVNPNDVLFVEVDCDKNESFCSGQKVTSYPALKLYTNGKEINYDGPRVSADIVSFVKKNDPKSNQ